MKRSSGQAVVLRAANTHFHVAHHGRSSHSCEPSQGLGAVSAVTADSLVSFLLEAPITVHVVLWPSYNCHRQALASVGGPRPGRRSPRLRQSCPSVFTFSPSPPLPASSSSPSPPGRAPLAARCGRAMELSQKANIFRGPDRKLFEARSGQSGPAEA